MVWLLITLFIAGFGLASLIWNWRFRDRKPVGCLIVDHTGPEPEYYLNMSFEDKELIENAMYITIGVVHHRKRGEQERDIQEMPPVAGLRKDSKRVHEEKTD